MYFFNQIISIGVLRRDTGNIRGTLPYPIAMWLSYFEIVNLRFFFYFLGNFFRHSKPKMQIIAIASQCPDSLSIHRPAIKKRDAKFGLVHSS